MKDHLRKSFEGRSDRIAVKTLVDSTPLWVSGARAVHFDHCRVVRIFVILEEDCLRAGYFLGGWEEFDGGGLKGAA